MQNINELKQFLSVFIYKLRTIFTLLCILCFISTVYCLILLVVTLDACLFCRCRCRFTWFYGLCRRPFARSFAECVQLCVYKIYCILTGIFVCFFRSPLSGVCVILLLLFSLFDGKSNCRTRQFHHIQFKTRFYHFRFMFHWNLHQIIQFLCVAQRHFLLFF